MESSGWILVAGAVNSADARDRDTELILLHGYCTDISHCIIIQSLSLQFFMRFAEGHLPPLRQCLFLIILRVSR